jgi:hypothetical protein
VSEAYHIYAGFQKLSLLTSSGQLNGLTHLGALEGAGFDHSVGQDSVLYVSDDRNISSFRNFFYATCTSDSEESDIKVKLSLCLMN